MGFDHIDRKHAPPKADTTAIRRAVKEYLDPWLENLHPIHECTLLSILREIAEGLDDVIADAGGNNG